MIRSFLITFVLLSSWPISATPSPQKEAWSFGISSLKHSLKARGGVEYIGPAAGLQIGYGRISDYWFTNASVDILLGPYQPTQSGQIDVDYSGTGITLEAGLSAHSANIRSADGGYGFVMGLNYGDTVGRNSGINRKSSSTNASFAGEGDETLLDEYSQRVTYFALSPQIFFSWLQPPRPIGNTPELLTTRIEGYMLTLGGLIPLSANYAVRYTTKSNQSARENGSLYGYSITAGFKILLGP